MTVDVTLTALRDSPGTIYCIALKAGNVPASIYDVMAKGTYVNYPTALTRTSIMISSLLALKSYDAFCYVQNANGAGMTYVELMNSKISFETGCCQAISFVNSPVSVYGNVSAYGISTSPLSYMFSYTLDSAPLHGEITVTPTITLSDGSISSVAVLLKPPSGTFRDSDSPTKLRGVFYISTQSSVSGNFQLQLVVSGATSMNYTSASAVVSILSLDQPLPAPVLMQCIFSDSGGSIVIIFDSATDLGGIITATWPCSLMFTFKGSDVAIWYVPSDSIFTCTRVLALLNSST